MNRIAREKQTIQQMITLYCIHKEGNKALCLACRELLDYAHARLDGCPFGEGKCSCKGCAVHCYAPAFRAKICVVMRYAGPRMLLYHPLSALRHLLTDAIHSVPRGGETSR